MSPRSYNPCGCDNDMSEGERMALECMDEEDEHDYELAREQAHLDRLEHMEAPPGVWNSTAGPIPMQRMTDGHIKNALRWLKSQGLEMSDKGHELRAEQERRAERAKKAKKARKAKGAWPPVLGSLRRHP